MKAQAELNNIVRIPEFHDKKSLPYTITFINETLQWRPVAMLERSSAPCSMLSHRKTNTRACS
ncbi:hypothetical protein BDR07DRAFT_1396361 [Suillus spraguei]|nr:hypothetical protein BDR07DRAFT_1396361 [Suillus spraguei]